MGVLLAADSINLELTTSLSAADKHSLLGLLDGVACKPGLDRDPESVNGTFKYRSI